MTDDRRSRFEAEALPHLQAVFNVARRLTRRDDDARDLTQEAFLRAFDRFESFASGTNCKGWLFRITYSLFVNRYHRGRRERELVGFVAFDDAPEAVRVAPESPRLATAARAATEAAVETALAELPEESRAAVILVDVEDLSYEEAAAALDCPIGTVRSRLFRARKHLAVKLRGYDSAQRWNR